MIMVQQMAILFIVMMAGLLASKLNIITSDVSKKLSSMVVKISNPCFIVSSVLGDNNTIQGRELLLTAGIAVIMYIALMLVAAVLPKLLRVPQESSGVYRAMTVFSNIGFMGFPIISGIYGTEALLYAVVFVLPFNLLIYTYGIYVMRGKSEKTKGFDLKSLINPGVIASLLAILIYLTSVSLPVIISSSVNMIGSLTAPLSMMVIGASFAEIDFKTVFRDGKLLLFSAIKLVILPIIGMLVIRLFISNTVIQGICLIMLATPVGGMVPMLATEYGGDVKLGATGVAVTSILSVATLSLVSVLLGI